MPERFVATACAAGARRYLWRRFAGYAAPYPSLLYLARCPRWLSQVGRRKLVGWGRLAEFERPFLHVAATRDRHFGTREMQDLFVEVIPGAKGQKHTTLDAGHFIQDNKGEELAHAGIIHKIDRTFDPPDFVIFVASSWGTTGEYLHPIEGVSELVGKPSKVVSQRFLYDS